MEINVILNDFGFLSTSSKEYTLLDFQEYFEKHIDSVKSFVYDEVNMCFIIDIVHKHDKRRYIIDLTDEHKELLSKGKADEDVLILMKLIRKFHIEKRKEEIIKTTRDTGKIPTDIDEIKVYGEYLEEQLKETKANIRLWCSTLSIPVILGILTQASCQNGTIPFLLNDNPTLTVFLLTIASMFGFYLTLGSAYVVYFDHEESTSAITDLKRELKEFKRRYLKLIKLKLKCEQLGLLKEGQSIKELPVAEEDNFTYEVPSTMKI